MTLPRPVLFALLGLALCAAAFLATRNAGDTGSAVTAPAPVTSAPTPSHVHKAPATAAKPAHGPATHKSVPAHTKAATKAPAATTKPATPAKPAPSTAVQRVLPVLKALGRGDVVVFFFTNGGAADDTGAQTAVKGLAHEKHVSVFRAGFKDLETFRPVLNGAGVSQVPAIVVVRAGHPGRLIEGFVDAATLRQTVADARR